LQLLQEDAFINIPFYQVVRPVQQHSAATFPLKGSFFTVCHEFFLGLSHPGLQKLLHLNLLGAPKLLHGSGSLPCQLLSEGHDGGELLTTAGGQCFAKTGAKPSTPRILMIWLTWWHITCCKQPTSMYKSK
jgi:hypothetical protein